jgi:hypothetical protein
MLQDFAPTSSAAPEWPVRLSVGLRGLASFVLAVVFALGLMANAVFDRFDVVRFAPMVLVLLALQSLISPRLVLLREHLLYLAFAAYMTLSLLWAPDRFLGMNSLLPTLNFVLIMVLYSSMLLYGERRAVIAGTLVGFIAGAVFYTVKSRFPFIYPDDFPYNAVASLYLFGLFITCLWGWEQRLRVVPIALGLMALVFIAATTSIKTNLGILLGAAAAAIVYRRRSLRALRRSVLPVLVLGGGLVYALISSQSVIQQVEAGFVRVTTGAQVLTTKDKERDASQLGLETRERWKNEGVAGWLRNPVLGYGVEAFRADTGITYHSTPVDLLYNFGVIGFGLFYSVLASLMLRLLRAARDGAVGPHPLILGGVVCYGFISLSGTIFYNGFLAVFIATGCVLARLDPVTTRSLPVEAAGIRA